MRKPTQDTALKEGFRQAEAITRQNARTFYFASKLLPPEKRNASYAVYAMCRLTDDAVDRRFNLLVAHELNEVKKRIAAIYENGPVHDSLQAAFKETVLRYAIPRSCFDELLAGVAMDLSKTRYDDFEELRLYCYRVAGVVGLIMLKIFGAQDAAAQQHAIDLGIAFQLTNILRDIKEDFDRGRVYLPQDELKKFGVSEEQIARGTVDENFVALLKFQIERARRFYRQCEPGIPLIADRPCRRVASVMKILYGKILTKIEQNRYDVFSRRACTGMAEKLGALLGSLRAPSCR